MQKQAKVMGKNRIEINPDILEWNRESDGQYVIGRDSTEYSTENYTNGAMEFMIKGTPFKHKTVKWSCKIEPVYISEYTFVMIQYKAEGLLREKPVQPVVSLIGSSNNGSVEVIPLLKMSNIITDGCWHTIIVKKKFDTVASGFIVEIASEDSLGIINIKGFEFVTSAEDLSHCCLYETQDFPGKDEFYCLNLNESFNSEYDCMFSKMLDKVEITPLQKRIEDPVIMDGGRFFDEENINVGGIPFIVKTGGANMVSPPPESGINDEIVNHFGLQVKRGSVTPVSRDDVIEVDVNVSANEVFFLMASEIPVTSQFKFIILDSTVEGQLFDEVRVPFSADDIERFVVELIYVDGTMEMAFPYSIRDRKHVIQGAFGAYAVQASSDKLLKKVVFHNRMRGSNFHIVAITINQGNRRFFVEKAPVGLSNIEKRIKNEWAICDKPLVNIVDKRIQIRNSYMSMDIDISEGFSITRFDNRWLGLNDILFEPTETLCFSSPFSKNAKSTLNLLSVTPCSYDGGEEIELIYTSNINDATVEFKIEIRVGDKPEISFKLTAVNKSLKTVHTDIFFPILKSFLIGTMEDTWYLFPKYRNIISNKEGTFCSQAAPTFPMQFYDIYNPKLDAGCYIMTKEHGHTVRSYGLSKDEKGVTCFIQYPENHTELKPSEPFECSETVIGAHKGDWHGATDSYRQWLKTWYKPFKAQNKQWYRESFWMIADITDTLETEVFKLPAWYDEENKHYKMRDIVEEHKRIAGRYPDILHFWCWCYSFEEKNQIYGGYGNEDYDRLGGITNFRKALDNIQKDMQIPVSLYMNATLCHKSYPVADELGIKGCMKKEDGSLLMVEGTNYRMCHSFDKWRDYMVETYKRVYRETGARILYIDEFSLLEENFCFSHEHGHEVPLNLIEADNKFIKAVRNALPEDVVLYGEFPAVDTNSQYIDCNINYYNVDMVIEMLDTFCDIKTVDSNISPVLTDLYRFIFPGIVQLNLPIGIRTGSWHPLKFTFFNGEAIYDSFWDVEESRAHEFILKAYDIKKEYADCFTSDSPETLVPTESEDICANRFPGTGRTLWTLYNRAYCTNRGELFSVEHTESAVYYDLWNKKQINARIFGGRAYLTLEMGPQSVGCIVKTVSCCKM